MRTRSSLELSKILRWSACWPLIFGYKSLYKLWTYHQNQFMQYQNWYFERKKPQSNPKAQNASCNRKFWCHNWMLQQIQFGDHLDFGFSWLYNWVEEIYTEHPNGKSMDQQPRYIFFTPSRNEVTLYFQGLSLDMIPWLESSHKLNIMI